MYSYGKRSTCWRAVPLVAAGALTMAAAGAAEYGAQDQSSQAQMQDDRRAGADMADEKRDAQEQVREATTVVERMKRDPKLVSLLQRAHGVFVAPAYGKGAAIVGARGGEGVLLVRQGDAWSGPAFYNFGGISIGAQAGGAGGSFAMLLMNDRAVSTFKEKNNFALDANAGLTIVNYSANAQASAGKDDVIVWSDTEGLFAGASIGVSGIVRDEDENRAYYDRKASVEQVLSGVVKNPNAKTLEDALPDRVAAR